MRVKRKPLLMLAWHNSIEPGPQGPAEPMPPWVKGSAEKAAKPGTSFLIEQVQGRILCPAGHVVYQALDGSLHCITLERFKTEYEIINVAKTPETPEGEKK